MSLKEVQSIVIRVLDSKDLVKGVAFLIKPGLAVTCAHVIQECSVQPGEQVKIVFHLSNKAGYATVIPEWWDTNRDVAFIRLDTGLQNEILQVPPLNYAEHAVNHPFETFGFPDLDMPGLWSTGNFVQLIEGDDLGRQILQLSSGEITRGFSGAPVWSTKLHSIVGMVISVARPDDLDRLSQVAFAISIKTIKDICNEIEIEELSTGNPFSHLKGSINDPLFFFDRDYEIRKIFELLNSGAGVAVIGKSSIGKSSLLKKVYLLSVSHIHPAHQPVYIDLEMIVSQDDFFDTLCDQIKIPSCAGNKFITQLRGRNIVLLLDNVEGMMWNGFTREFRQKLRAMAQHSDFSLKIVLASCTPLDRLFGDSQIEGTTSPLHELCIPVEVSPWNDTIAKSFIEERLATTPIQFSEDEISLIINNSNGIPQKIVHQCYELFQLYSGKEAML